MTVNYLVVIHVEILNQGHKSFKCLEKHLNAFIFAFLNCKIYEISEFFFYNFRKFNFEIFWPKFLTKFSKFPTIIFTYSYLVGLKYNSINFHIEIKGGDDFKSGQTKLKSVLVDFLVSAGIKPLAITSYNHLGNNDGLNLNSAAQFRSKEISKTNVVDDMVNSNKLLYSKEGGEHPDHVVVIKYVPNVGDSKRALDEYENEIFMGGRKTISIHNTCEDSLLAAPLILDLCILTELMTRVKVKSETSNQYESFHPICSILSYMLKAPLSIGRPVNSLFKL